ncbi:nuclear pore membrane glycoprotein 210-like [Osmerus eperlanus]|uniref:nuclear pore membrane glycoprotein 210-like n=1 Tax=Osmerus eperlanus TaxID=29151 RepID=UPI002E147214
MARLVFKSRVICQLLIFTLTVIALSQCTKLNVPKLLLPRSTEVHVDFTLTVERGCYTWLSSKPDAVSVQPLSAAKPPSLLQSSACSQQALVSSLSHTPLETGRGASLIQGQDTVTGHTLRCDVHIDHIHQIRVVTTTRQLFTDDPPLQLSVVALDSGGNTFSSLAGLQFQWVSVKDADTADITRFVRFSEAGYSSPRHILSLEEAGRRGDVVLLEGVRSGVAWVRVSLVDPEYKGVEPVKVILSVTDRLYLSPAHDTYLLLGSSLSYRVWKTVYDARTDVVLGVGGYELVVERDPDEGEDDVVTINQETATVTAVQLGHATLSLKHPSILRNTQVWIAVVMGTHKPLPSKSCFL